MKIVRELLRIFQQFEKHEAHRRSLALLQEAAASAPLITDILHHNLGSSGILNKKHYPVLALPYESNPWFTLVANCWIPLPDRNTDISTKAIHHHGNMLISTATIFGPGYEHWMFSCPTRIADTDRYVSALISRGQHGLGDVSFVDAFIAHVPFYARELTITLALWSNQFPVDWRDRVKRMPFVKGREASLRKIAVAVGLTKSLDLKVVNDFDFAPTPTGLISLHERDEFPLGPNADYLQSLFHVIQATGNEALAGSIESTLEREGAQDPALVRELLADLRKGAPIEARLSPGHYGVEHANFTSAQILESLEVSAAV